MKISNKPDDDKNKPFAEIFRLQTEFQARLADETLRYLRRLQGSVAPASPGNRCYSRKRVRANSERGTGWNRDYRVGDRKLAAGLLHGESAAFAIGFCGRHYVVCRSGSPAHKFAGGAR